MMHVTVVGAGYVGLVAGLCLAARGLRVSCVDIDATRIARLLDNKLPFHEPGLDALLTRHLGKCFFPTTDLATAVLGSELTLIAVGTPFNGGAIDLRYVADAAAAIGRVLRIKRDYHVVVVKSTVVPGTTDEVVCPILEETSGKRRNRDFGVGMNPEFLREGEAVNDFMEPDRIVLGADDSRSVAVMDRLYSAFHDAPRIYTNTRTAEMIKYASNTLFATLISFSNEIGHLCSAAKDVDVTDVLNGVHLDRRITTVVDGGKRVRPGLIAYLKAGCGFGGSCLPKDLAALIRWGKEHSRPARLLQAVNQINEDQPREVVRLLENHLDTVRDVRVAVLGLAFKPGTDDVRESPALRVIADLRKLGAQITAYDPIAAEAARAVLGDELVVYRHTLEEAVADAEAIIVLTAWAEFEQLPELLGKLGRSPVVIDGRRVLERSRFARYDGIGLSSPVTKALHKLARPVSRIVKGRQAAGRKTVRRPVRA